MLPTTADSSGTEQVRGQVLWYNAQRGYGMLRPLLGRPPASGGGGGGGGDRAGVGATGTASTAATQHTPPSSPGGGYGGSSRTSRAADLFFRVEEVTYVLTSVSPGGAETTHELPAAREQGPCQAAWGDRAVEEAAAAAVAAAPGRLLAIEAGAVVTYTEEAFLGRRCAVAVRSPQRVVAAQPSPSVGAQRPSSVGRAEGAMRQLQFGPEHDDDPTAAGSRAAHRGGCDADDVAAQSSPPSPVKQPVAEPEPEPEPEPGIAAALVVVGGQDPDSRTLTSVLVHRMDAAAAGAATSGGGVEAGAEADGVGQGAGMAAAASGWVEATPLPSPRWSCAVAA
jgi:hypothetical protein